MVVFFCMFFFFFFFRSDQNNKIFAILFSMDSENSFSEFPASSTFLWILFPQKKTQQPVRFLECIDRFPLGNPRKLHLKNPEKPGRNDDPQKKNLTLLVEAVNWRNVLQNVFFVVATLRWVFCKLHLLVIDFKNGDWLRHTMVFLLKEVLQNAAFWQFPPPPQKNNSLNTHRNNPPAFRFKDTNGGDLGGDSNTMFKGANFQRCLAKPGPMDGTVDLRLINHWFPLIRPLSSTLISGGGMYVRGYCYC